MKTKLTLVAFILPGAALAHGGHGSEGAVHWFQAGDHIAALGLIALAIAIGAARYLARGSDDG